jgi:hypothetical protein
MCFSFEVSLGTGIFCWAVGLYLLQKPLSVYQRRSVISLLIFSSIQFADALLWSTNLRKTQLNYLVTSYLIPTLLSLQILYAIFVEYVDATQWDKVFAIGISFYLFVRFRGYSSSLCDTSFSSPIWGSKEIQLWEILIFAYMISRTRTDVWIGLPFLFLITDTGYGSMWCAIACVLSVYYLKEYT